MLKTVVLSELLTVGLMCGQPMAQTVSPSPGTPPTTDQETPPATAPQAAPPAGAAATPNLSNKEIVAGCKNDARAKGLRGAALRSAIDDCVGAQNPTLAARMRCSQQGKAQGVARGNSMRAFIRNCLAQGK